MASVVYQDGPERAGDSVRAVHPAHAQGAAGAGLAARHRAPDRLSRGHTRRQDAHRKDTTHFTLTNLANQLTYIHIFYAHSFYKFFQ